MFLDDRIDLLVSLRREVWAKFSDERPPTNRDCTGLGHAVDCDLMRAFAHPARAVLHERHFTPTASRSRHRLQKARLGPEPAHDEFLHRRPLTRLFDRAPERLAAKGIERGPLDEVVCVKNVCELLKQGIGQESLLWRKGRDDDRHAELTRHLGQANHIVLELQWFNRLDRKQRRRVVEKHDRTPIDFKPSEI